QNYKGKLRGAIVLNGPIRKIESHPGSEVTRKTEAQLLDLANFPAPVPNGVRSPVSPPDTPPNVHPISPVEKMQFFVEEGVGLVIEPTPRGDGGTLFVEVVDPTRTLAERPGLPVSKDFSGLPPQVVVAAEQYNRMVRMIQGGERLKAAVDL